MSFKTVASTSKTILDITDAYTVVLTNESDTIACDTNGTALVGELGSTGNAKSGILVYKGNILQTAVADGSTLLNNQYSYSIGTGLNCTGGRKDNYNFYISTINADSGQLPIIVKLDSGATITKTYTWAKAKQGSTGNTGSTGPTGPTGANGQSVTSVTPQFVKHTSSTVAPTSATWYDTCPVYEVGAFLWIRSKVIYANPTNTVYTTPYHEASWEAKGTADDAKTTVTTKVSEFQQTLGGFELTVSETYVSKLDAVDIESALNSNIDAAISGATADILQNVGDNYATADEFASFSQSVSSKFEQTSSDITASFGIVQSYTQDVDGKLEEFQNTIGTHIRFSVNGMDLGRTDSPFTATLDNQELAFKENGVKVAHIGNNTMNITRAEVSDVLRIGEIAQGGFFTFAQGPNGNMSLKWSDE